MEREFAQVSYFIKVIMLKFTTMENVNFYEITSQNEYTHIANSNTIGNGANVQKAYKHMIMFSTKST